MNKFTKFYAILIFISTAIMGRSFYVILRDHLIATRAIMQKPVQIECIENEE